jgi:hypothetical protein
MGRTWNLLKIVCLCAALFFGCFYFVRHIQSILEFMYRHTPPGTLTLVLGLVAAMASLPRVAKIIDVSGWRHAAAIFIFCSIAAFEIAVISHDRDFQQRQFDATTESLRTNIELSNRILQTQAVIENSQEGLTKELRESRASVEARLRRKPHEQGQTGEGLVPLIEEKQLKIETLELTRDIGEFLQRKNFEMLNVPYPQPPGDFLARARSPERQAYADKILSIQNQAVGQFEVQFGQRVQGLIYKLRGSNVFDSKECDVPRFDYIVGCAQDLQRAAEKLP